MTKLSIIIPVYNCERYLKECLDSVRTCPVNDMECILVNDGSSDASIDICNTYHTIDPRFKVINQKNQGVSAARNNGIEISSGEYLMFLDADDYFDSSIWPKLMSDINHRQNDFIAYSYYSLYESGDIREQRLCEDQTTVSDLKVITSLMYASSSLNTCWGKVFLAQYIRSNHITFRPDLKIGEDFVFVADYFSYCSSPLLDSTCILYYRQHGESAMRKYDMSTRLHYLNILYDFNLIKVKNRTDDCLLKEMNYYYFCMVTDLFLDFAKHKPKNQLRKIYKQAISQEPVVSILKNVHGKDMKKIYKKLEYFFLNRSFLSLLSTYFKFKAKMDQRY